MTPGHLPSCCLLTFVNTAQTLNCAAFSWDAARVLAGFSDSTVRVYDQRTMAAQQLSEALQRALAVDVETLMARAVTTLSGHSGAALPLLYFLARLAALPRRMPGWPQPSSSLPFTNKTPEKHPPSNPTLPSPTHSPSSQAPCTA